MNFFENILEKLDGYLDGKKESEKKIIIYGIGILIAFVAYYVLLPFAQERYEQSLSQKDATQKILDKQETYLSSITVNGDRDYKVKELTQQLARKKKNINDLAQKSNLINSSMEKLSDMIFDPKSWSTFLDSLTHTASQNGVDILQLDNNFTKTSQATFGHVLEIKIKCKGDYKDILKFMNAIEQNRLVTDIYGSSLKPNKRNANIIADLNISVWGINK